MTPTPPSSSPGSTPPSSSPGLTPPSSSPGLTRGPPTNAAHPPRQTRTTTAGLGCRRNTPAAALVALVRRAEQECGHPVHALAAPHFKHDEPGLHEAAATLQLPLRFIDDPALAAAQPRCPTRSESTRAATGHPSIAEAAALAATGGTLLLPRITDGQCTCAVAR